MKSLKLAQSNWRVRVVWLGVTAGLAMLFLALTIWGMQSVQAANRDVCPTCTYMTIQAAIEAANDGDVIRVVQGTYTGTMTVSGPSTAFTATVVITKSLTLLGGFNADFSQRDPQVYTTTIDGEFRPYPVVAVLGSQAVVDGLAIINGHASSGGGLWIGNWMGPTAVVTVSNNLVAYNQAASGGGIYLTGTLSATITGNHVFSNTAATGGGGGLLVSSSADFVISNNQFRNNFAGCCGGGMAAWGWSQGKVISNTFGSNSAHDWMGGGMYLDDGSYEVFSNTVTHNQTLVHGGGGIGVGSLPGTTDATIIGNLVVSNTGQEHGGGIFVAWGAKAVVQSNQILSNTSHDWFGSGLSIVLAEVLVDRNLIAHNVNDKTADGAGAIGISMDGPSQPVTVTNNVIVNNTDKGIMVSDGVYDLRIVNNTIAANRNEGILAWGTITVSLVRNNIVASNGYCGVAGAGGAEFRTVDYNNVWQNGGGSGNYCDYGGAVVPPTPGTGSLSTDPRFTDAASGDYHLQADSPCIDAGTSTGAPSVDIEGTPRDTAPDIGAYEWGKYRIFLPLTLRNVGS